ncbi:MAG: ATP-dependent RecD-like DNA helicase [Nitrospirota bacterium]
MDTEIKAQIERITFHNEENGYTVAKVKVQGRSDLATVVGNLLSVNAGEVLLLKGQWQNHTRYGEQFKISSYQSVIPATANGIEKYLGSGLIKGIGPVMAKRLVSRFGAETLDIIGNKIERLREVDGIGEKRIEMIRSAWEEQKEIRDVMLFLQGNGVSPAYAVRIYRQYGREAVRIVQDNPYRLAMDIFGIGFITADRIAGNFGIPKDSQIRAEAGILYVLNQLSDDGHVYYPYEPLISECKKVLDVGDEPILGAFGRISEDKKIFIEDMAHDNSGESNKGVYLSRYHVAESGIARNLKTLCGYPKQMKIFDKDKAIDRVQRELNITLAEKQKEALSEAFDRKVMVITGGPGTGKTTIINSVIKVYQRIGHSVLLAAPTGRAAKRMAEATGFEAKTLHRLLEFSPGEGRFKRNEDEPLEADLIIVDETSMVDTILMHYFLKAVPRHATLILVGDVDQLPSVGAGNVLKDIIDSGTVPSVRLNEIFRQSRKSLIIVNAHRINSGHMPLLAVGEGEPQDFYFFPAEEPEDALKKVIELCAEKIPNRFGYDPVNDIQVITPMHRGTIGTANLNAELQKALNPSTEELAHAGKKLRKGDKAMQIRNNYDKEVYNGDIGRIAGIDRELQEVVVDYDGRRVAYNFSELDEIVPAYAISVHKSQGSEYPVVVMPLLTQHYMLLQRNLLYTAITRGKRMVVIVGTKKAIAIAVKNNKPLMRYTFLRQRLKSLMHSNTIA